MPPRARPRRRCGWISAYSRRGRVPEIVRILRPIPDRLCCHRQPQPQFVLVAGRHPLAQSMPAAPALEAQQLALALSLDRRRNEMLQIGRELSREGQARSRRVEGMVPISPVAPPPRISPDRPAIPPACCLVLLRFGHPVWAYSAWTSRFHPSSPSHPSRLPDRRIAGGTVGEHEERIGRTEILGQRLGLLHVAVGGCRRS